jgi:hypothetical protein
MTLEKAATARTGEAPVHNQLFVIIAISLAFVGRQTAEVNRRLLLFDTTSSWKRCHFFQVKKASFWPLGI